MMAGLGKHVLEDDDGYTIVENKKAKSDIWLHFGLLKNVSNGELVPGVAVCQRCRMQVKYSGGTTNLNTHMTRHHKMSIKATKTESLTSESDYDVNNNTKIHTQQKFKLPNSQSTVSTVSGILGAKYKIGSPRYTTITNSVANFIVKDLRPYSIVSDEGFRQMIKTLDPRYNLPCRTTFSETIVPSMYESLKEKVKSDLSQASALALTTDSWTSRATDSYVTITSVHITPDWQLRSYVLQTRQLPVSHTGVNLASVIKEALLEWNITCTPVLVTDNASNMLVMARELNMVRVGCYAHTINLAAQKSLRINQVSRLLGRIRNIVAYFHRSTTASYVLKSKIKTLDLKKVKLMHDVSTRWNSTTDMIERFLELQPAIFAALMDKEIRGKEKDLVTLNEDDISLAEDVMCCLKPLRDVTNALCTEKEPTVSIILPLQTSLINSMMQPLNTDRNVIKQMKQTIIDDLSPRYTDVKPYLEECTALDPRFKVAFLEEEQQHNIYSRLAILAADNIRVKREQGEVNQVTTPEPDTRTDTEPALPTLKSDKTKSDDKSEKRDTGIAAILKDVVIVKVQKGHKTPLDRAKTEVEQYREEDTMSMSEDVLKWWSNNVWKYPLLASLAQKRLCIPATSVPSERVFSTAGDVVTAQRASLSPENVDMLIFLKKNH